MPSPTTLHLLCGKIAAGKSTLAARLARAERTVLVAEDHWLSTLYPDAIVTLEDYRERSARLEGMMAPHLASVLRAGAAVVLDFHMNTRDRRDWAKDIAREAGVDAVLHWLDPPDAVCRARLRARNAAGTHAYEVSDAMFDRFTAHYDPPDPSEGWTIERYDGAP